MGSETQRSISGWTIDTLAQHVAALAAADTRFDSERDRRYAEVALEREKALKIKEEADKAALGLAREIQTYKDEKANELREQIASERGLYATQNDLTAMGEKIDAQLRPITLFISSVQGKALGVDSNRSEIMRFITLVLGLIAIGTFVFVTMRQPSTPQIIYVPAPPPLSQTK